MTDGQGKNDMFPPGGRYNFKINQGMIRLLSVNKKEQFLHMTSRCDIDLRGADLVPARDTLSKSGLNISSIISKE